MRTIVVLALMLSVLGTSVALAADYATADANAMGHGTTGFASASTATENVASGNGASGAIAANSVNMNSKGVVVSGGSACSESIQSTSRLGTVGVSTSKAISYTAVVQSPCNPTGAPENSGATAVAVQTQAGGAGGVGSSAGAVTSQTGNGYQISKDSQTNVQVTYNKVQLTCN